MVDMTVLTPRLQPVRDETLQTLRNSAHHVQRVRKTMLTIMLLDLLQMVLMSFEITRKVTVSCSEIEGRGRELNAEKSRGR